MVKLAFLPDRAVIALSGHDRVGFLNGLVSNDVAQAAPDRAVWAALLTAQGKWLADFFIFATSDRLLLDCEAAQAGMILQRLLRYKLRADISLAPTEMLVHVAWGGAPEAPAGTILAPDPRLAQAGWRLLAEAPLPISADATDWDLHRLALGLPDGSHDMEPEKTILLEAGFDELNGVSWTKGCYMGQELTARTRYRGLVKRRMLMVRGDLTLPPPGTRITSQGRDIGHLCSSRGTIGLATLRLDAAGANDAKSGDVAIAITPPYWARLPQIA